jgi:hypothetical protein
MGMLQSILSRLLPESMAQEMEAETRQWQLRWSHCGHTQDLWEAGGIRWKKRGKSYSATWARCPHCGHFGYAVLERK